VWTVRTVHETDHGTAYYAVKFGRLILTFWGPFIMIYSYNRSQQVVLSLNFILIYNSTCFGQTYCPSSGVLILYSQQLVFVILWIQYQNSWWQTVSLSETCRVVYQNKVEKLCILLASIIRIWLAGAKFFLINLLSFCTLQP